MKASAPLIAASHLIARWRREGHEFEMQAYLSELRKQGPADHARRFRQLIADFTVDPQMIDAIEMSILANAPTWMDDVVHSVLWPRVIGNLAEPMLVLQIIRPWLEPPLGLTITVQHVRALAIMRLASSPSDTELRTLQLLVTLAESGCLPGESRPLSIGPAHRPYLMAALRFWDTPEMVPALMLELDRELSRGPINAASTLDRLRLMSGLACPSAAPERLSQLAQCFAAVLLPLAMATQPVMATPLFQLTQHYGAIRHLLRAPAIDEAAAVQWYLAAAQLLDMKDAEGQSCWSESLRRMWAVDFLASLTGVTVGSHLLTAMLTSWCEVHPSPQLVASFAALCQEARVHGFADPKPHLMTVLEEELARDSVKAAGLCRFAPLLLGEELSAAFRARLLAELHAIPIDSDQGSAVQQQWSTVGDVVQRAAGELARQIRPDDGEVRLLIWEILFSAPSRLRFLRAPLLRAWNRATFLGRAAEAHAAAQLLALL